LSALGKPIQRCGKSVDITDLDVLVGRKPCVMTEGMDIGTSGAGKQNGLSRRNAAIYLRREHDTRKLGP
jgi:hypothetical protein